MQIPATNDIDLFTHSSLRPSAMEDVRTCLRVVQLKVHLTCELYKPALSIRIRRNLLSIPSSRLALKAQYPRWYSVEPPDLYASSNSVTLPQRYCFVGILLAIH